MILLDGSSLDASSNCSRSPIAASRSALARRRRAIASAPSRAVVDRRARGDEPAYGINTGFGSFADVKIAPDALETLQLNLLRSHAAGLGDPLPVRAVRATMALRANVLAKGFSGIRVETLDALIALLNRGVHPRVPSRGSVGASGDLAPLAHLALVLIGEGEALDDDDDHDDRAARSTRDSDLCGHRALRRDPRRGGAEARRADADRARAEGRARAHQRHAAVDRGAGAGAGRRRAGRARGRHRGGAVDRRAARIDSSVRGAHPRGAAVPRPARRRPPTSRR